MVGRAGIIVVAVVVAVTYVATFLGLVA